jgi:hypothetical protein
MHWLAAKFMPSLLSEKQENCVNMCLDFQASKSLSKIITGDLNMGLWV